MLLFGKNGLSKNRVSMRVLRAIIRLAYLEQKLLELTRLHLSELGEIGWVHLGWI